LCPSGWRRRARDGFCRTYGGTKKAIASFGNRLNIPGTFGVVAQRFPQLADGDAEAAVEIDKRVSRPDTAPQFFAADHLPSVFQKHDEEPKRLLLQLHALPVPEEFARGRVHLKLAELIDSIGRYPHI
jgi:hypothetical protein